ncbi:hypothetical protein AT864_01518 [Anoxybacillus sp. P3H1B]|uniref:hypothetical protein n=1 Tax=Anoxybacillus sp. P3H1B TaxID=1769293 RepID=UPI000795C58D|nr:hypothetical protein [Anoxybacillus sp. P3H1B]KXG09958.1 hypothetical protein AT864_01518 [Anoxybacillus sp. P3H1B]
MALIKLGKITNNVASVDVQVFDPSILPENELENYIEVGEIPTSEVIAGKMPILMYNLETNELFYEYVDRPLTPEEKLQLLKQENQDLKERIEITQQALDDLILGGM